MLSQSARKTHLLTHGVDEHQTNGIGMCQRIQPWMPLMNFSREELFLIFSLIMEGRSDPQGCLQTGRTTSESRHSSNWSCKRAGMLNGAWLLQENK